MPSKHHQIRQLLRATITILLLSCSCYLAKASSLDSILIKDTHLFYHKAWSSADVKKGLVIYMHGGVSQYKGEKPFEVSLNNLVEGNMTFISTFNEQGYDLVFPIAYNEYNWLVQGGQLFIKGLLDLYAKGYDQVIIAGFSDGGTGAFKMFYDTPHQFDGLMVFNGYPQHDNYYKTVDHPSIQNKKIIFASSNKDKLVPYEFQMLQFRRQQMINLNTSFLLIDGKHLFNDYQEKDFKHCLNMLKSETAAATESSEKIIIYPPIDGLIIDGEIVELYPFRKKWGKTYSMAEIEYTRDDYDQKALEKFLKNGAEIKLKPIEVSIDDLKEREFFEFEITVDDIPQKLELINWLSVKTW